MTILPAQFPEMTAESREAASQRLSLHGGFMHLVCNSIGVIAENVVGAADINLHLVQETAMLA